MKWTKLGRIFQPNTDMAWNRSHAMLPIADHEEGSIYRIYFSGRDEDNRSIVGYVRMDLNEPGKVLGMPEKPCLVSGQLGCFDDNGVTPSWIVNRGDEKYLYYIGWKPRCTTRMSLVAGLARSVDNGETFTRVSRAPVLRATDAEPYSVLTAPCVLSVGEGWRMWYVSGVEWIHADLPRYNIKCAESADGIEWNQTAHVCIDFASDNETALARPCVLFEDDMYKMWFSYKTEETTYRIGYAESPDGLDWERMDHLAGIDVSAEGWDSEMIEYSYVFNHEGTKYMLYNGNGYGENGIGLAVLEQG